jgi:hypothetical protein
MGVGVGVWGTKNTRGVPASSVGIGVRRIRVDMGIAVKVAVGTEGVAVSVGDGGGKVGATT